MTPFPALGVGYVLLKAARDKDMRRQRVVFPPHFLDGCIHFAHSVAECCEGILARKVKHRSLDAQPPMPPTLSRGRYERRACRMSTKLSHRPLSVNGWGWAARVARLRSAG